MKMFHIMFHGDWECSNYVLIAETEADAMLNLYNWFLDTYYDSPENYITYEKKWWNEVVESFRNAEVIFYEFDGVIDIHQSFD